MVMNARRAFLAAVVMLAMMPVPVPVRAQEAKNELHDLEKRSVELIESVKKATVAIYCKSETRKPGRPVIPRRARRWMQRSQGFFGSGAVIAPEGFILTSTSVVPPDAREIKVYFCDGREYEAQLIGSEERNNVALIKIGAENLDTLPLGSSKDVKVGQLAFTAGNPYHSIKNDHQVAFSMGVLSGIYRLRGDGQYHGRVIETDAALNHGNDGGPLIDAKGEIVGVLNLGYSYSRWLNTAVPVDQIKYILEDLKQGAKIYPRYGFLQAQEALSGGGVEVIRIRRRGPARRAGFKKGDIILEVDGTPIERADQLERERTILPPGSELTFLVRRGYDEMIIRMTSGKIVKHKGSMGVTVDEVDGMLTVSRVVPNGAAEKAGLAPGDRLLEIDGREVTTLDELAETLEDFYQGDTLEIVVERDGSRREFDLRLKRRKQSPQARSEPLVQPAPAEPGPLAKLTQAFQKAADNVRDCVVSIDVERDRSIPELDQEKEKPPTRPGARRRPGIMYFRRPAGPVSGVILSSDGYIATSFFNVRGNNIKKITVTFPGGQRLRAYRLGWDENTDIALLKVDALDLPAAKRTPTDKLRPGHFAIVVGRGEDRRSLTLNSGVVSATNRLEGRAVQIDAALNYANTGGAVVDIEGNLIGIACHVSDIALTGQNSGVGFMTPSEKLAEILPQLKKGIVIKKIKKPFLGVAPLEGASVPEGAHVAQVLDNTAAARAGMQDGDIIIEFNGVRIKDWDSLRDEIAKTKVADMVKVKVIRNDEEVELEVTMGERP